MATQTGDEKEKEGDNLEAGEFFSRSINFCRRRLKIVFCLKKKKNSNCSPARQSTFNQYQYLNKVLNA